MELVRVQEGFLRGLDSSIEKRDMSLIRSDSKIDFTAKLGMLASNFASFHEIGDHKEDHDILSFEIKPKSGVTEFVPSCVHKYIEESKHNL